MEIRTCKYEEVEETLGSMKPDLLDESAIYQGAYIKEELVGVVSYVCRASKSYLSLSRFCTPRT